MLKAERTSRKSSGTHHVSGIFQLFLPLWCLYPKKDNKPRAFLPEKLLRPDFSKTRLCKTFQTTGRNTRWLWGILAARGPKGGGDVRWTAYCRWFSVFKNKEKPARRWAPTSYTWHGVVTPCVGVKWPWNDPSTVSLAMYMSYDSI